MTAFQIFPLSEKPEHADDCAAWSYGEWATQSRSRTLESTMTRYRNTAADPSRLPATWICLREGKLAGMVSLKEQDHPDITDLSPWLASLFVHPYHRGKGVARALIKRCEEEARKTFRFDKIYLFTADADGLYAKLGWTFVRKIRDPIGRAANEDILMEKVL